MNILLFTITNTFTLWIGAASQCADPLLFKLSEIRAEITSVTLYCNEQNQQIATLNKEIADLKGKLARFEEDVSFSATLEGHTSIVINDNPTVFPTIRENKGSGYNSSTGISAMSVYCPCNAQVFTPVQQYALLTALLRETPNLRLVNETPCCMTSI